MKAKNEEREIDKLNKKELKPRVRKIMNISTTDYSEVEEQSEKSPDH